MKTIKLTLTVLATILLASYSTMAIAQRPQPSDGVASSSTAAPVPLDRPITLPVFADLQIVKSVGVVPHGGSTGTFVVVVTNHGPGQAAAPIVINDTLTGPATIIAPAPAGCAGIPGTSITCTLNSPLNAGQSVTLTFTTSGNPATGGMAQNCATVRSATKDNNDSNNRDCSCMDFKRCFDTTIDVSTGANNGAAIPIGANDPHWSVKPPGGNNAPAVAINRQSTAWVAAPAGAQWISSSANATTAGQYVYTFNFNLGSDWPNRDCRLDLNWAADNDLILKLDNPQIAASSAIHSFTSFNALHHVVAAVIPPTGAHTITAIVNNAEGPTGLLISGKVICSCKKAPTAP
ncbi:MAG: hypothetical protein QOE82_2182 [Thermoanaerobaculia bacterium]|jgi:hypothetical protein|nr:hypothetical protein [Thermoanaerobaculia bacterium]